MSGKPINEELYRKTRAFVISALRLIASYLQNGETIPSRMAERTKMEKSGGWTTSYISQPMYDIFLDKHRAEIESLPEYVACIDAIRSDLTLSKHMDGLVGLESWQTRMTPWGYLSHFLIKQISEATEKFNLNPQTFDSMYFNLERFIYDDTVPMQAIAPLQNFESDVHELDLGNEAKIRRLSTAELEQLMDQSKWSTLAPSFEIFFLKHAVELTYRAKKQLGEEGWDKIRIHPTTYQQINEQTLRLVTALRLFKRGAVGFSMIKTSSPIDLPLPIWKAAYRLSHTPFSGSLYELKEAEVSEFRRFWENTCKLDLEQPAPIGVAIRRLNYSYERDRPEDKLVDYMVAFEALFFKEGEAGEYRHKLSVRVARFLEQEYNQRTQIATKMAEFYDKRSVVVHGEPVRLSHEFTDSVEDYLRKSIVLFLERLKQFKHSEILNQLDLGS